MDIENQKSVWDNIAKDWHKFKLIPSELTKNFLSSCKGNVLDLGSGSGRHLTKIPEGIMYLVDFSKEMLELAKKKSKKEKIPAEFIQCDFGKEKLPFKKDFFDGAIFISALHCIPKEEHKKSVKELYRVLKPNSKALIGVWNFSSRRFKSKRKKGKEQNIGWTDKGKRYYYLFEEPEVHKLFKDAGFKILSEHNSEMMINFVVEK